MKLIHGDKYADEVALPSVAQRVSRVILGGMLASAMVLPAGMAFAVNQPSSEPATGEGRSILKMITAFDNNDGSGVAYASDENIAFTVPSVINMVLKADGRLIGPTNVAIENQSEFPIHVDNFEVDTDGDFSLVADALSADGSESNIYDLQLGPSGNALTSPSGTSWISESSAWEGFDNSKWNMGPNGTDGYFEDTQINNGGGYSLNSLDIGAEFEFDPGAYYFKNSNGKYVEIVKVVRVDEYTVSIIDANGNEHETDFYYDSEIGEYRVYAHDKVYRHMSEEANLLINISGHAAHIMKDVSQLTEFASIDWHVKAGIA